MDTASTPSTTQTIESTVLSTTAALLPALALSASPAAQAIETLAPIAIQLFQAATQMQQAGAMSSADLAALFASIGQGVAASHAALMATSTSPAKTTV